MIVAALMGLHFLPRVEVFGIELRRVDLLSDLFPDTPDVSEKEMAEAMKQQRPHPAHRKANDCPKGMVCIDDYSMDERRNMDVFYRRLAELNTLLDMDKKDNEIVDGERSEEAEEPDRADSRDAR